MNSRAFLVVGCSFFCACATAPFDVRKRSEEAGLRHSVVRTELFEHDLYFRHDDSGPQYFFIEGDGRPWTDSGTRPAHDPTPVRALAWELLQESSGDVAYVTRPCYFAAITDQCSSDRWTSGRYSADIVNSMTEALARFRDPRRATILVGYSGGGALALLVANRLPGVSAVVTVSGLIDTGAWTGHHHYDALDESLNPADLRWDGRVRQIHLLAGRDTNIPPQQSEQAISRWPGAESWIYEDYDHACCWEDNWPEIWQRLQQSLSPAGHSDP